MDVGGFGNKLFIYKIDNESCVGVGVCGGVLKSDIYVALGMCMWSVLVTPHQLMQF